MGWFHHLTHRIKHTVHHAEHTISHPKHAIISSGKAISHAEHKVSHEIKADVHQIGRAAKSTMSDASLIKHGVVNHIAKPLEHKVLHPVTSFVSREERKAVETLGRPIRGLEAKVMGKPHKANIESPAAIGTDADPTPTPAPPKSNTTLYLAVLAGAALVMRG